MRLPVLAACLCAVLAPASAVSQLAVCALTPTHDGELRLGADFMSWRTARAATIEVVTTAPVSLYVNGPSGWVLSPARTPATNFSLAAQLSGANSGQLSVSGGGVAGALTRTGATQAAVSLTATAASAFSAGVYATEVTVTCAAR